MLPPHFPNRVRISLATCATSTAVSCSSSWPRPKRKAIAFPAPPLRRLVLSSLRILVTRQRSLGGGWLGRRRGRKKAPGKEVAALVLALAFGGRLGILVDSWRTSGLGQALGVWAALSGRGRRKWPRRLAALLVGIVFCALIYHFGAAVFVQVLGKTGGGRRLLQILLH